MIHSLAVLVAVPLLVVLPTGVAATEDDEPAAQVEAGLADLSVGMTERHPGTSGSESTPLTSPGEALPSCKGAPAGVACRTVILCEPDPGSPTGYRLHVYDRLRIHGLEYMTLGECEPTDAVVVDIPGQVANAFRRIPLPAQHLEIQPPGGKTLVNFDTIFSANAEPFTRVVHLLGRRVELRIWPSSFHWVHGDGTSQASDHAGRPYARGVSMSEYITHQYTDAETTVTPRVDTTYAAEFRVGSGPWRRVDGSVTITGPEGQLQIVQARPVLVGNH